MSGRRKKRKAPAGRPPRSAPSPPAWLGPACIAIAATVAVWLTLAPEMGGPGITCDELYHVAYGKRLVTALGQQGLGFFSRANIAANFPWEPGGPPVHPPLGNFILGLSHRLLDPQPDNPEVIVIVGARFAPGLALGVLVFLVGWWTARMEGALAGTAAAAAVVLVPRVFGHAHLAALDTLTALSCIAALVAFAEADARRGPWWHFALAGAVWGLACLVRLHGLLLAGPIIVHALAWRRWRAALPLAVWGASGVAVLFALWPWLWLEPVHNFLMYLSSGSGRQAIHVFYEGRVWNDVDTPWHYPLVMFAATVPLGLLVLGLLGLWARRRFWLAKPGFVLAMSTWAFVLLVFALPGVPVYDGVRLFLPAFPLWAVAVGVGARWLMEHRVWRCDTSPTRKRDDTSPTRKRGGAWFPSLARRASVRAAVFVVFLAVQGTGLVVYWPCWLSHYSLLVGGLAGADRLGFEATYWGDAVPESLLAEGARRAQGGTLLFGPNLAPFQAPAIGISSPSLIESRVTVTGWESGWVSPPPGCRYAVFYHRKADLAQIPARVWAGRIVAEHNKRGVWLARLVELPATGDNVPP